MPTTPSGWEMLSGMNWVLAGVAVGRTITARAIAITVTIDRGTDVCMIEPASLRQLITGRQGFLEHHVRQQRHPQSRICRLSCGVFPFDVQTNADDLPRRRRT